MESGIGNPESRRPLKAVLTRWLVREGDWVERDGPLYEISTDRVDQVIESPRAGRIAHLLVAEGEEIDIRTVPLEFEVGGSSPAG